MQGAIQVLGAGRPWFMVQPTLVAMSFGLGVSLKCYSLVAAIFAAFRATNDFVAAASYCGALHEVARSRASQGFWLRKRLFKHSCHYLHCFQQSLQK